MNKITSKELTELKERCLFWENQARIHSMAEDYYRTELEKAHTILGRVIHQLSERWDNVNLTKYFPTDNLHHKRNLNNPKGV